MIRRWLWGLRGRFAVAALAGSIVAIASLAIGVLVVAADTFTALMREHGSSAAASEEMFGASVSRVFVLAALVAIAASVVLAVVLARRLAGPLQAIREAARRIAQGDYAARIPPRGPEEIAGLADSFNRMASSLEEQERLERDFIANASHELRTPLTNLRGYLEALRDGVIAPSRETFESLSDEVERLARLAEALNALAEDDAASGQPEAVVVDMSAAVCSAVDLAQPSFDRAGLTVAVDVVDGRRARAAADHVPRVLGNLLQNAVRYTPRGGRVCVEAAGDPTEVTVSVTNTGPAIPAEDVPHVWERFYRVEKSRDASRGGAGIGLAIVRQLVEADGGRVGMTSRDAETRCWFTLPR